MADVRIKDLPLNASVNPEQFLPTDLATAQRATIQNVVDAGAPIASQVEAEAATNPSKRMTPLTVGQAISALAASSAQGQKADSVFATVADKFISIREFGAQVNGNAAGTVGTDDTTAVQQTIDAAASNKVEVSLPSGYCNIGNILLRPGTAIRGQGPGQSYLRQLAGMPGGSTLVNCAIECNDIILRDFAIDGGWQIGDATGPDALRLWSSNPTVDNILIDRSSGWGMKTLHTLNDLKIIGRYTRIVIDRPAAGGWDHAGPNDSFGQNVQIIDASQSFDLGYPGFRTSGYGTISMYNMHVWNRTTGLVVPRPSAGVRLEAGGQSFTNCRLESGAVALIDLVGYNNFMGVSTFAPDGSVAIILAGPYNQYIGLIGGNKDLFYPDYVGVQLGLNPSVKTFGNVIIAIDAGCTLGAVDFTNSAGNNTVIVNGYKAVAEGFYLGTPQDTDKVDLLFDGPNPLVFSKDRKIPWLSTVPTVSSSVGSITAYTSSLFYKIEGSTCHFRATCNISTNGTADGSILIDLPVTPKQSCSGNGSSNTLKGLSVVINAGTQKAVVATYNQAYAGGTGVTLLVGGSYEIA